MAGHLPTVVVYHRDCADGMAAAWAAWRALGSDHHMRYLPLGYEDAQEAAAHPDIEWADVVYFVDFSWKRRALLMLLAQGKDVVVLDHHKTAAAELTGIEADRGGRSGRISCVFDMTRSGARISWDHFAHLMPFPYRHQVPALVQYVEDRDLWRFKLPWSREVSAFIRSYPLTLADYDILEKELYFDAPACAKVGARLLAAQQIMVDALCREADLRLVPGHLDPVPVCNVPPATLVQSEVCEELLRRTPGAPFAAVYGDISKGRRRWSLRSRPDEHGVVFDVSALCRANGGGGHMQAAGFTVDIA